MSAGTEQLDADLLLQHASSIRQLALRLVRDPAEAEDLVQDTWAAALSHAPSTTRSLRPWLGTVLRNLARRAQRRSAARPGAEASANPPASVADPAETCEGIEAARLLTEELGRLDEPYRTALYLRYYQDLEPVEIARRLGIPPATLRSHLKRGVERLRVRLDERHGGRREDWCVLLAPLCRFKASAATSVAAPAIATTGILAMNATLKVVAALAAVALVYVGLSAVGVVPERLSPFGEPPARAEAQVAALDEQEVPAAEELPAGPQLENERHAIEAAPRREALAVPPTETTAVVEALLTNELGIGLPGAELRPVNARGPAEGVLSSASGFVSLPLEVGEQPRRIELEACARGHATVTRAVTLTRGETTDLGPIALPPGGAISGVVFDEDGRGIEGALVSHEKRGAMALDLEAERYQRAYGNPLSNTRAAPRTTTDRNGAFTLRGLPEGHVRLWAEAGGSIPSFTEPIEVHAGLDTHDVEIVLQAILKANSVAGRVVSPDGEPIPHAILEYKHESLELHYSFATSKRAEADGSFRFALNSGSVLSITARDPQDRYGPRTVEELEPGASDLELRLSGGEEIELVVNGEDDLPLPEFRFAILDAEGTKRLQTGQGEAGVASFRLPPEDFLVQVSAPLHERVTTDPLPSAKIRKNVVISLERVPGIHGRVFAAGEPVIGATVELYRLVSEDTRYEHQGFRCWLVPRALSRRLCPTTRGASCSPRATRESTWCRSSSRATPSRRPGPSR